MLEPVNQCATVLSVKDQEFWMILIWEKVYIHVTVYTTDNQSID